MSPALGYLVAAAIVVVIGAFVWSQLSVVRARRYPRQQPKPDLPEPTTNIERPVRAVPDEPTARQR